MIIHHIPDVCRSAQGDINRSYKEPKAATFLPLKPPYTIIRNGPKIQGFCYGGGGISAALTSIS
jgi:hypothetical protein